MRTVDPALWSERELKPAIQESWSWRTGHEAAGARGARGLEARLRRSLRDALGEYWAHCTVNGFKYMLDINATKTLRYFYGILMLGLVLWGVIVTIYVDYEFRSRPPLHVNLRSRMHGAVTFPAVAICSNAVISKKALNDYTKRLLSQDNNSTHSRWEIRNNLMNFGALITLTLQNQDLQFMRFLYNVDPDFNVTELMYELSPKCPKMLQRCSWRGHNVECDRLFASRVTPLGFCCVFNSRYQKEDLNNPPKSLDLMGSNYGLSVMVVEDSNDFAVVRRPTTGFDVLLFEGAEYPLLEGGAVRWYPVQPNASHYFSLAAHAQLPADNLQYYSEEVRGCRMKQLQGARGSSTSYSWCLTECRRRTLVAVCNCLPFTLLPNHTDTICAPEHLFCLNKHKEKLVYYYPGDVSPPGLDEEMQDSQSCLHCVPDCGRLLHGARTYHAAYYYPHKLFKNAFSKGMAFRNTTLVRFYYESLEHSVYGIEINQRWYEALATTSSQAMFLLCVTLVNGAELVFHLTLRWGHHFIRRAPSRRRRGATEIIR